MADLQLTNTYEAIHQLESALRALERHWADTQSLWNDSVSQHFESAVQTPLAGQSATVLKHMQTLAQTLEMARRTVPVARRSR